MVSANKVKDKLVAIVDPPKNAYHFILFQLRLNLNAQLIQTVMMPMYAEAGVAKMLVGINNVAT